MLRVLAGLLLAATTWAACPPTQIFQPCDVVLELNDAESQQHPNPYRTVSVMAEFKSPRARTFKIYAFADGPRRMVLRLVPTEAGTWTYKLTSNIARWEGNQDSLQANDASVPGFVMPANVYHWRNTHDGKAHLWMGDNLPAFASIRRELFDQIIAKRKEQKFTHLRGYVLGSQAARVFPQPDQPDYRFFQELDQRIKAANANGLIVDLLLAGPDGELSKLFPTAAERQRYLRYIISRYAGFNITWHGVADFETYPNARALMKDLGTFLKINDPYAHPRTTGAQATSAPFLGDGWMQARSYARSGGRLDTWTMPAVEHQLFATPALSTQAAMEGTPTLATRQGGGLWDDPPALRRNLWLATAAGQYPYYTHQEAAGLEGPKDTAYLESPGAKAMTVWFDLMLTTRWWDLRPHFDVDGGRGLALPTVETLVFVERREGPIEVIVEGGGHDVYWINPADGERRQMKDWRGTKFVGTAPDNERDWILHLSRDDRKSDMAKSWKFEYTDVPILMQEVDAIARVTPFAIDGPKGESLKAEAEHSYVAKLVKPTRATRELHLLWTMEVTVDGEGYRVAGVGKEGTFRIPRTIAKTLPGVLSLRLYGMNANGKVYLLDKAYTIE